MIDHQTLLSLLHYDPAVGVFTTRAHRINRPVGCFITHALKRTKYLRIKLRGKEYRGNRLAVFYMTGACPTARLYSVDGDASNVIYDNITLSPRETIDNSGAASGPALERIPATTIATTRGVTVLFKRIRQERKLLARNRNEVDRYFAAWGDNEDDLH